MGGCNKKIKKVDKDAKPAGNNVTVPKFFFFEKNVLECSK